MEDTFEFTVTLKVRVPAFDKADAEDVLYDTFGPGSECGVEITSFEVSD